MRTRVLAVLTALLLPVLAACNHGIGQAPPAQPVSPPCVFAQGCE